LPFNILFVKINIDPSTRRVNSRQDLPIAKMPLINMQIGEKYAQQRTDRFHE